MITPSPVQRRLLLSCALVTLAISACLDSPTVPRSGYVNVRVTTSGGDQDDSFEVVIGNITAPVPANKPTLVGLPEGTHSVELKGVAINCMAQTNTSRVVDVENTTTTDVTFDVACVETGIRVETRVNGFDPPATFVVKVSPQRNLTVPPNDARTISRLAPGHYQLSISAGTSNCSIAGDSTIPADVINRQVMNVRFNIECTAAPRSGVIAFHENDRLMIMNADGSGRRALTPGWQPSWSRDGTRIVYSTTECDEYDCSGSLEIVDPTTSLITALPKAGFAYAPAWSPVDDVIAFSDGETAALHLYDVATATKSKVALERKLFVFHPSWSPDGSRLVSACSETPGKVHICLFNRDGTGIRYLTSDTPIQDSEPSWSPDGARIVFTRYLSATGQTIAVINADGSGLRTLTNGISPSWSPDSRQIIFGRTDGLYILDIDGPDLRHLTEGYHYSPVWRANLGDNR